MPTTPPMARAEALLLAGAQLGLGADRRVARACVAASITERSCAAYAATASLSSGTRSARRRSSASTSPQAALRAVAGARQAVVEQHGEDDDDRHDRCSSPDQHAARLPAQLVRIDARGSRGQRGGSKRSTSSAGRARARGCSSSPALCASQPTSARGSAPRARSSASPTAPWRFASRSPSGAEQQRDVRVARARASSPSSSVEPELTRRRVEQIGAAHDVRDALGRVVDDDRELVGDDAVAAAQRRCRRSCARGSRAAGRRGRRGTRRRPPCARAAPAAAERAALARARSR